LFDRARERVDRSLEVVQAMVKATIDPFREARRRGEQRAPLVQLQSPRPSYHAHRDGGSGRSSKTKFQARVKARVSTLRGRSSRT